MTHIIVMFMLYIVISTAVAVVYDLIYTALDVHDYRDEEIQEGSKA